MLCDGLVKRKTKMKNTTINVVKEAMNKLQEAIDLLETVKGENEEIDEAADSIGFAYADLEFEINS